MILGDIIQRISSLYSRGIERNSNKLSERHIYNKIITIRSLLLYRKINKKQKISIQNYQTLSMALDNDVSNNVIRTENFVPNIVNSFDNYLIDFVGNWDESVLYSRVSSLEFRYRNANKYTKSLPVYTINDRHIYVNEYDDGLISIKALFEDPLEVYRLQDRYKCVSSLDLEFPIDSTLLDSLVQLCVEELIMLFQSPKNEKENGTS